MARAVVVCALALVSGAWGWNGSPIAIRLVNSARVPATTVAQSEQQATRVLAQAGVDVQWRDCSGGCPDDLAPGEFWMHVALWKPTAASEENLGFTARDASVAGVYYPTVRETARALGVDEAAILAAALAHEIGHLLGLGHSAEGIMCPVLDRARLVEMSQGALLFAPAQASQLRAHGVERLQWGRR